MRPTYVTTALAAEHRNQLLRDAKQYRLARSAAGRRRGGRQARWHRWWAPRSQPRLIRPAC